MRKSPANNRPVRKTRHPEDLSKYVYTNEKELVYIRYKSRIICTRRFFSLQQSGEEGKWFKFTTILCLCYVCFFVCVRFAPYVYTQTRPLHTRVFKVAPEVKAYLDRASDIIQSDAVLPGEYLRIYYMNEM